MLHPSASRPIAPSLPACRYSQPPCFISCVTGVIRHEARDRHARERSEQVHCRPALLDIPEELGRKFAGAPFGRQNGRPSVCRCSVRLIRAFPLSSSTRSAASCASSVASAGFPPAVGSSAITAPVYCPSRASTGCRPVRLWGTALRACVWQQRRFVLTRL